MKENITREARNNKEKGGVAWEQKQIEAYSQSRL